MGANFVAEKYLKIAFFATVTKVLEKFFRERMQRIQRKQFQFMNLILRSSKIVFFL